ncbi:MAG: hypothetical protein Q8P60_00290, partial [Pseudorhodobacter sp.]|nr:hypothetical protein [Pseudorhodobacter sp.]
NVSLKGSTAEPAIRPYLAQYHAHCLLFKRPADNATHGQGLSDDIQGFGTCIMDQPLSFTGLSALIMP